MQVPTLNYTALTSSKLLKLAKKPTIVGSLALALVAVAIFGALGYAGSKNPAIIGDVAPLVVVSGFLLTIIYVLVRAYVYNFLQRAMLTKFAADNSLTYNSDVPPSHPGFMFQVGDDRAIADQLIIPTDTHPIEIGNYTYVVGSGKNRTEHRVGYMHLKLPRKVPHIVLDAKANNFMGRFSNLPTAFDNDQVLELEGDFNKYFTLYAPREYERDALYVFTPDVMQALVSLAGDYDVELVDDSIFLYSTRPFTLARPDILQGLLLLASRLSPEFESQTDRYADERIANFNANIVAEDGRRLKGRFPWIGVTAAVAFVAFSFLKDIYLATNASADVVLYILLGITIWSLVIWQFVRNVHR